MQYNQPLDTAAGTSYVNADPALNTAGSIIPAAAIEYPQREIANFISDSGLVPSNSDLHQLGESVQAGTVNYAVDSGVANAIAVTLTPTPPKYSVGMTVRVKVAHNNTGAATININTLGATQIKRAGGGALSANDINAGAILEMAYDGSVFQITNFGGISATTTNNNTYTTSVPYIVDTGTVNAVVAPFSPAITLLTPGLAVEVNILNTNTGPCTIKVNALAAVPIVDSYGLPLGPGMLPANSIATFTFNGSAFQFNRFYPRRFLWDLGSPPASDTFLYVDDQATITFSGVTAIPLGIAAVPGVYEVLLHITANNSTNSDIGFYPNNTSYSGAFFSKKIDYSGFDAQWPLGTSSYFGIDMYLGGGSPNAAGALILGMDVLTFTAAKMIKAKGVIYGTPSVHSLIWNDVVTVWSSLGTIYVSLGGDTPGVGNRATVSGKAIVKRIF